MFSRSRRRRSRSLKRIRGGRRSLEERNFPKCDGKKDFLTQEYIPEEYAFRLGKTCFDIRSLVQYIDDNKERGVLSLNPFNREELTEDDFAKINRKLKKLRMEPLIGYHPNYERLFQKVWGVLAKFNFVDSIQDDMYDNAYAQWESVRKPNPKEYLAPLCDPDNLIDPHHRLVVDELDHPQRSYYTVNKAKLCMKAVKEASV